MGASRFQLERFESVASTSRHALLRIRGHWLAQEPATLGAPQLAAAVAGQVQRYAPLDPREARVEAGPDPALWRCAFAVPADLLEAADASFEIVVPEGAVQLPAPVELEPGEPAGQEAHNLLERREAPDRRRPFDRRTEHVEAAHGDRRHDTRRRTPDRRRRRSRAELDAFARKLSELETHAASVEAARSELQAAHEQLRRDLEEAHAAREAVDIAAAEQTQAGLAEAEQRAVELEARAADAQARVHSLEEHATDLAARALTLEQEARAAQDRVQTVEAEAAESAARADDAVAERDLLAERLERVSREQRAAARDDLLRQALRIRELEAEARELRRRAQLAEALAGDRAHLVAQLEDHASFAEQAGASLWATERELGEMRSAQKILAAERDAAAQRAREAANQAARLASRLRAVEGTAAS